MKGPQEGDIVMPDPEDNGVHFITALGLVSGIIGTSSLDSTRSVLGLHLLVVNSETDEPTEHVFSFPHPPDQYGEIVETFQTIIDKIREL